MKKVFIFNDKKYAKNYINALKKAGASAIVSKNLYKISLCDGLLLCGGGDITPLIYGKKITCRNVDLKRDICELYLIEYFTKRNLPVLGVCRGMQILNVAFGGTLKNISFTNKRHFQNKCDLFHSVNNLSGFMSKIYNDEILVNSAHRQCLDKVSPSFSVCARSNDKIIEGIEHKTKKVFGVQFHPERMPKGEQIYHFFVSLL